MSNLTILTSSIQQIDNLYSLNDLHAVSGAEEKHRPNRFTRLDTTQELVAEIQRQEPTITPIKTLRGVSGGTYACEEIALAYAMWISPKFHLIVLRAFLAMHKAQQQPQQLALPEPELESSKELLHLLMKLATYSGLYRDFQEAITGIAEDKDSQREAIMSRFASMNGNSYLFVFHPNIEADLKQAHEILMRHAIA